MPGLITDRPGITIISLSQDHQQTRYWARSRKHQRTVDLSSPRMAGPVLLPTAPYLLQLIKSGSCCSLTTSICSQTLDSQFITLTVHYTPKKINTHIYLFADANNLALPLMLTTHWLFLSASMQLVPSKNLQTVSQFYSTVFLPLLLQIQNPLSILALPFRSALNLQSGEPPNSN